MVFFGHPEGIQARIITCMRQRISHACRNILQAQILLNTLLLMYARLCQQSHIISHDFKLPYIMRSYHHLAFCRYFCIFTLKPRAGWFSAHPPLLAVLGLFYCVSVHPRDPIFNLTRKTWLIPPKQGFLCTCFAGYPFALARLLTWTYLVDYKSWLVSLFKTVVLLYLESSSMSWASLPHAWSQTLASLSGPAYGWWLAAKHHTRGVALGSCQRCPTYPGSQTLLVARLWDKTWLYPIGKHGLYNPVVVSVLLC